MERPNQKKEICVDEIIRYNKATKGIAR